MATHAGVLAPVPAGCGAASVALSAEAAPFVPQGAEGWRRAALSDAEKEFSRCAARLRALRADSGQLRDELNLLFDQLLSENYNKTFEPSLNIRPEVAHTRSPSLCNETGEIGKARN